MKRIVSKEQCERIINQLQSEHKEPAMPGIILFAKHTCRTLGSSNGRTLVAIEGSGYLCWVDNEFIEEANKLSPKKSIKVLIKNKNVIVKGINEGKYNCITLPMLEHYCGMIGEIIYTSDKTYGVIFNNRDGVWYWPKWMCSRLRKR